MKLRSLGIAGLLGALGVVAAGCSDDPTVQGSTSSGASSSSSSSGGEGGGTGGTAGMGGSAGAGGMGGSAGNGGMGGTGGGGMGGMGGGGVGGGGVGGGMGGAGGSSMPSELCANGMDDDMDGMADCMDMKCATSAVCGKLIINEVDYDQPSTDTAEFVELYNAGTTDITLDGLELVVITGSTNLVSGTPVPLTGTVPAGQYFVIAGPGVMNIDPNAVTQQFPLASNNVQNGGVPATPEADAILIRDTVNAVAIDAICYECATPMTPVNIDGVDYPLVAGTSTNVTDSSTPASGTRAIIRFPNGADTNDDNADWKATTVLTPGAANQVTTEVCNDGVIDEDADDKVDCDDSDCTMAPNCIPPEVCTGGMDEDGDGNIDCADMDCDMQSCGANGVVCMTNMCSCPGGDVEMACGDMMDNDCNGLVDCDDSDCTGTPACSVEICDNMLDEDGDGNVDCADMDCDMKACGDFGLMCMTNTCTCPGGMSEMCADMMDNDCDGQIDCNDSDCTMDPACKVLEVTSVNYPIIAHGGTLVVTGKGFTGATAVTIGGTNQMFTVTGDTQITITPVEDATPIAAQDLVVTTPAGMTMPFGVTVIRLQINETDADTMGTDTLEFVEISTGVPNVNLKDYTLVFWNGAGDTSYYAAAIDATTDADGLVHFGNSAVVPAPDRTFGNGVFQNGIDGVSIHQTPANQFSTMNPQTPVTGNGLIDALVYHTSPGAMDPGLADVLTPGSAIANETTMHPISLQRCGNGRRNNAKFVTGAPTTGAPNNVPACP